MSYILVIDIPVSMWMSANRTIANHHARRRVITNLHWVTKAAASAQIPHLRMRGQTRVIPVPVIAAWTIQYPKGTGRKADAANASPTTKACLDALVPLWLADDGPDFVVEERFRRGPNLQTKSLHTVTLTLIPEAMTS